MHSYSRVIAVAILLAAICVSLHAHAQKHAASSGGCTYWMDAATGKPFPFPEVSTQAAPVSVAIRGIPQTYVLISGNWMNTKTKKPFPSPADGANTHHVAVGILGVYRSYVLMPCTPPPMQPATGESVPLKLRQ